MMMHGPWAWLYLGEDGPPVIVKDWAYDVSRGLLRPAVVTEAVSFRLYPVAAVSEAPPPAGDQHFRGVLGPGGQVSGVWRYPSGAGPAEQRELAGRLVRQVWVEWAREQPDPKPSWLLPWEELDDGQREVDMRIGEALHEMGYQARHAIE